MTNNQDKPTRRIARTFNVRSEAGEGVISAAIAVLVMAAIGALMWVGFSKTFNDTNTKVDTQVQKVGE